MKKKLLCLLVIIIVICAINWKNFLKIFYITEYSEYVEKYSREANVDHLLIYAIIKVESNFKIGATSRTGALGLMQLMDKTAKEVADNQVLEYESGTTLYDPEKNIQIGITYYKDLLDLFKNDKIALAAYNAGTGNVQKWINDGIIKSDGSDIEKIPFKETNMYVRKILKNYEIYKILYEKQ